MKKKKSVSEDSVCSCLTRQGRSLANENNSVYTIHPPHLSIPKGKPGETRRIIMQFYDWTLICDEKQKLKLKQGICNVTQTVHDQEGNTILVGLLFLRQMDKQ